MSPLSSLQPVSAPLLSSSLATHDITHTKDNKRMLPDGATVSNQHRPVQSGAALSVPGVHRGPGEQQSAETDGGPVGEEGGQSQRGETGVRGDSGVLCLVVRARGEGEGLV